MSDDTVRLSMIGHILRERWRLLAAIAVIGALAGAGASVLFSPGYQASSSVLLQGTRNDSELKTEAQIAASTVVLDRTATGLGWNIPGIELQEAVTAKVADGNVITITGAADTPEQARLLADKVAEEYLAYSAQLASNTSNASDQLQQEQREALRRRVAETNDSITELSRAATQDLTVESVQVRTQLEALRTSLADAMTRLDQADSASSRVKMVVMGPAQLPSAPAAPTLTHFVAGGALVFFLIGILGHLVSARADRRLRGEPEIGAALGAPVLGDVDAPDAAHAQDPSAPWWQRVLRADQPWNVPEPLVSADDASRDIRYRRVLSRLRDGSDSGRRLLVLVADDDATARRALARLIGAAGHERGRTTFRVVEVDAGHPTVPDNEGESGVLVVLTAATRTGWELVGIAEACADAGHSVVGAVVAHRIRSAGKPDEPGSTPDAQVEGDAMAGSR